MSLSISTGSSFKKHHIRETVRAKSIVAAFESSSLYTLFSLHATKEGQ